MNFVTRIPEVGNYIFVSDYNTGVLKGCWKAFNKLTNEYVAIRTIKKPDFSNARDDYQFANEINLLKGACHPLVNKFIELIDCPKEFHIVMADPKGMPLYEYIKSSGPMDEKRAQNLIKKVFIIAQYLKPNLGLEYCSFSADSIYVDEKGRLSTYIMHFNQEDKIPSLLAFNPPEVITSHGYSISSDSWSISSLLYFALTSKIPFLASSPEETMKKMLNDQFIINDNISEKAKDFILNGLIKNPNLRTQYKSIMSTKFMEGVPFEMMASKHITATQSYSPKSNPLSAAFGKKQLIRISYKSCIPEIRKGYRSRSGTTFW